MAVKFLLVLLVVGVGLWMLTARLRKPGAGRDAARPKSPATAKPVDKPVEMVVCAHCGVHLPATDALALGAHLYCSEAHRRLGPAPNPPQ